MKQELDEIIIRQIFIKGLNFPQTHDVHMDCVKQLVIKVTV
jgi:hypothetical protein